MYLWRIVLAMAISTSVGALADENTASKTAEEIRKEVLLPPNGPEGRPLPLAGHWNSGIYEKPTGWAPTSQMRMIQDGHYLLPWVDHPQGANRTDEGFVKYLQAAMREAGRLRLPITLWPASGRDSFPTAGIWPCLPIRTPTWWVRTGRLSARSRRSAPSSIGGGWVA